MIKVLMIEKIAFDDTKVTIEGDGVRGELHMGQSITLSPGETIETKSFLGSILDSMKNLVGMGTEQSLAKAEAKVAELQELLNKEQSNLSVAQSELSTANSLLTSANNANASLQAELEAERAKVKALEAVAVVPGA